MTWVARAFGLCALLALTGCGSSDDAAKEPPTGPFVVSDYFVPAAVLQDAPGNVTLRTSSRCKARPPGARGDCYAIEFLADRAVGVIWQYPKGNYDGPGLPLPANLNRVSFFAATTAVNSTFSFHAGYRDAFSVGLGTELTEDWQRIVIELPQPSPTSVAGGFWFMNSVVAGSALYIDDLVYE